jgi:hypothetical protein
LEVFIADFSTKLGREDISNQQLGMRVYVVVVVVLFVVVMVVVVVVVVVVEVEVEKLILAHKKCSCQ